MNKRTTLASIGAACIASSALASKPLPYEVRVLQSQYAHRMEQSRAQYMESLVKLQSKYALRGDTETANQLSELIGQTKADQSDFGDLCVIKISANVSASPQHLKKGTQRLSGGYRPVFNRVCPDIEGAEFTRVPWKSNPNYKIEVQRSGYLYMTGVYKHNFTESGLKIHEITRKIGGAYVGKLYAVYVEKGQVLECGGYESCLIAANIRTQ